MDKHRGCNMPVISLTSVPRQKYIKIWKSYPYYVILAQAHTHVACKQKLMSMSYVNSILYCLSIYRCSLHLSQKDERQPWYMASDHRFIDAYWSIPHQEQEHLMACRFLTDYKRSKALEEPRWFKCYLEQITCMFIGSEIYRTATLLATTLRWSRTQLQVCFHVVAEGFVEPRWGRKCLQAKPWSHLKKNLKNMGGSSSLPGKITPVSFLDLLRTGRMTKRYCVVAAFREIGKI